MTKREMAELAAKEIAKEYGLELEYSNRIPMADIIESCGQDGDSASRLAHQTLTLMRHAQRAVWAYENNLRMGRDDSREISATIMQLAQTLGLVSYDAGAKDYNELAEKLTGLSSKAVGPEWVVELPGPAAMEADREAWLGNEYRAWNTPMAQKDAFDAGWKARARRSVAAPAAPSERADLKHAVSCMDRSCKRCNELQKKLAGLSSQEGK